MDEEIRSVISEVNKLTPELQDLVKRFTMLIRNDCPPSTYMKGKCSDYKECYSCWLEAVTSDD